MLVVATCLFASFSFKSNLLYSTLELWDHARYNYYSQFTSRNMMLTNLILNVFSTIKDNN